MLYRHLDIDAVGMGCNAAFPFDKGVLKMKKITYPADYAVLSNEEMTYTTGGGAVDNAAGFASTAATVVGAVVLASSYVWGHWAGTHMAAAGRQPRRQLLYRSGPRHRCHCRRYEQICQQLCTGRRFRHHGSGTGSLKRHPADRALNLLIR